MNTNKNLFDRLLIYLVIITGIIYLRTTDSYSREIVEIALMLESSGLGIAGYIGLDWAVDLISAAPYGAFMAISGLVYTILGVLLLAVFKENAGRGAAVMLKMPGKVIGVGHASFLLICIAIAALSISVVGIPLAAVIFALVNIAVFFGGIPLSVFMGHNICSRLNVRGNIYIYYLMGRFLIVLCQSIAVTRALCFYVFYALSLGIILISLLNKYYYGVSCYADFGQHGTKESFDRKKIRDIITRGID